MKPGRASCRPQLASSWGDPQPLSPCLARTLDPARLLASLANAFLALQGPRDGGLTFARDVQDWGFAMKPGRAS